MMRKMIIAAVMAAALTAGAHTVSHPVTPEELDTIREKVSLLSRVHLGGYGEAVYNYNFSSTKVSNSDALYEDSKGHSSLDIPRIVLMLGVNLGKGWGVETDVAFENCKSVSIDQFWIEKQFRPEAALRAGYLTLPVGLNAHDDPTEFFAVNRPVGEDEVLPCDWHQAGLSFFGESGAWNYEAILIPGINTSLFTEDEWIGLDESGASFSYSRGTAMGFAGRVENTSVKGLRAALSGYYGWSFNNRLALTAGPESRIRGNVGVLALDFLYDDYGWILRGNGSWGRYSKFAKSVGLFDASDSRQSDSKSVFAASFEGGYDLFNGGKAGESGQKLYIFGRYDYWQPSRAEDSFLGYDWSHRNRLGFGLNYYPIDKVVIKAEYSHTFLSGSKGVPMLSLGVAYSGQFF